MEACKREPAGISLADLMACSSDGKRIVADSMDTGLPVHIEEVLSGLACRCVCSGCGRRVVAHKGSMRRHFQHAVAEDHETCASPGETALHKFAKAVLSKALVLRLPELEETDGRNTVTVVREREFGFDKAILEKRQGEVVPDVVCLKGGRPLHVEFKVTHACGPEKVEKLKRMDVGAIEVDLSGYRAVALDGLEAAILTEAPRAWLHNPKSDVARRTLAKLESDRIEEVDRLAKEMVASLPPPDGREPDPGPWEAKAREYGFDDHIRETRGALGFKGRGQEWKAFILVRFGLVEKSGFTTKQVIAGLKEFGLLEERFSFVSDEVADGLRRAAGKEALSPWEAVLAFVADMKRADMLVASTDGRTLFGGKALFSSIKAAVAEAERPSRRQGNWRGLSTGFLRRCERTAGKASTSKAGSAPRSGMASSRRRRSSRPMTASRRLRQASGGFWKGWPRPTPSCRTAIAGGCRWPRRSRPATAPGRRRRKRGQGRSPGG